MNTIVRWKHRLLGTRPVRFFGQFSRNARLFLLSTVISGITFSGFQLFFNIYLRGRGFDLDFIGLLNAMPSAAALLLGVPMGILSDRLGRRRAMLLGLGVASLSGWGLITARAPGVMVAMSATMGIGNSLYFLSMAPFMMTASHDKERTLLFSLNFGLTTISGAAGSLLAGQLTTWFGTALGVGPESTEAYQAVLLASVLGGAMALIPIWLIRQPQWPGPRRLEPIGLSDVRRLFRKPVLRMALPNLVIGFGAAILIPYLNLFFKGRYLISDESLGLLFAISALLTGVATIAGPRLADRLGGKIKAVVVTQGASVFFLLVIGFAPGFLLSGAAFLVRGALMNMANPLYSAFTMEQTPERERGAVNSMLQLTWEVGWSVGPYLSGVVQDNYGFAPLFIGTAVLYSAAVALVWVFFRDAEARTRVPATVSAAGR